MVGSKLPHADNPCLPALGADWLAPAKLNLFLHITGRIPHGPHQGYHALQTYFQLIDYGDRISIQLRPEPGVDIVWRPGDESIAQQPAHPEDDLLYRAATLLKADAQGRGRSSHGVHITLHKHTPVGGGMGGGSSAAATVLRALNHYWQLDLTPARLKAIGVQLGADVPVFLEAQSAWAEGIGDQLTPCPSPVANAWFVVVVPKATSWTRHLFNHPDLPRSTPKQSAQQLLPQWQTAGFNAFEDLLLTESPEIRASFNALHQETGFARVTGSGACLFSPVENQASGQRIAAKIKQNTPEINRVIVAPSYPAPQTPLSGPKNI